MKRTITKLALVITFLVCAVPFQAWGSQMIVLQWSGASLGNSAKATGWMTVDATQIPNPGSYLDSSSLPSWLTDLSITVSGASLGDGTFTMADFSGMYWDTAGITLNLNAQLVGQTALDAPWGALQDGSSGDLNFFGSTLGAPLGTTFFTLTTNGFSGDRMVLTSAADAVPEPATYSLLAFSLLGILTLKRKRT
jgi:hypothetical protein